LNLLGVQLDQSMSFKVNFLLCCHLFLQRLMLWVLRVPFQFKYLLFSDIQVLQSVLPIRDEDVVLGQYEGYRDDPTVPDQSNTPTFATVVLRIHNERWEGIFTLGSIYSAIYGTFSQFRGNDFWISYFGTLDILQTSDWSKKQNSLFSLVLPYFVSQGFLSY